MNDAIAAWEDEGGSAAPGAERRMTGTVNQVVWAEEIKTQANAEFDRVRKALEAAGTTGRRAKGGTDLQTIIHILEDKRAEVMRNDRAGYFIREWQELRNQVSQLIRADPRYRGMKAGMAGDRGDRVDEGPIAATRLQEADPQRFNSDSAEARDRLGFAIDGDM